MIVVWGWLAIMWALMMCVIFIRDPKQTWPERCAMAWLMTGVMGLLAIIFTPGPGQ